MSSNASVDVDTELNEQDLLGPKVHIVCCWSNKLSLCGHVCKGKKLPSETPSTCADCVEIGFEHPAPRPCYWDETICVVRRPDNPDDAQ